MSSLSQYWTLMRLTMSGQVRSQEIPSARAFVQELYPPGREVPEDRKFQRQLYQRRDQQAAVQACFRCYISHQTVSACNELVSKFGQYYGFSRQDILPYVLDDDGQTIGPTVSEGHQPLSLKILEKFDPDKSSLKTWARRLIDHSDGLNQCLNQFGLWRISDWGVLNQAKPNSTRRILAEFHSLTASEIEQNVVLLESYRAVYLKDRLVNGEVGKSCQPPTGAQLERMSRLVQSNASMSWAIDEIDSRLLNLAARLRQYSVYKKSQHLPTQSLDRESLEREPAFPQKQEDEKDIENFLDAYQEHLSTCLAAAIQFAIEQKLQKLKPAKHKSYLEALRLLHCEGLTMEKIAPKVGIKTQAQVSKLLQLKEFRSDVRHRAIADLKTQVQAKAARLVDPDWLEKVSHAIEDVLTEQIDELLITETKSIQTSRTRPSRSSKTYFSKSLCAVLAQF